MASESMPAKEAASPRRRALSLSAKFFIMAEAMAILAAAAAFLLAGWPPSKPQGERAAEDLRARAAAILESLADEAAACLSAGDAEALSALADRAASEEGIEGAAIAGLHGGASGGSADRLWASSGEGILAMIGAEGLASIASRINPDAEENGGIGRGSHPPFEAESPVLAAEGRLFLAPVFGGGESPQALGYAAVEMPAEGLLDAARPSSKSVFARLALALCLAALIGAAGSFLLFVVAALPIRRIARGADAMRRVNDKSLLRGMHAEALSKVGVSRKDEIGQLAESIGELAHLLAEAANREKELTIGKETQKMLIPLDADSEGRKLAYGGKKTESADFFGYYEAASGVSGDYFDYIRLDGERYAFIKCDVAGSGVSAALVMVEIAAIFKDFFGAWSAGDIESALSGLAAKINDLIEERETNGLFAALMLGIFNCESGRLHLCGAGDTVAHIFDAAAGKMEAYLLCESPAAGIFPSTAINGGDGFITEELALKKGDALFLYTDGISEAKRLFRDENFMPIEDSGGEDGEILSEERVAEIIEAVFGKGAFSLKKRHDPEGEREYRFDFSGCEGTVEEAVAALVSVEKVFRMYKDPAFTGLDCVRADLLIDSFLQRHFAQYSEYCSAKRPHKEAAECLLYEALGEDSQFDDLAILAIMKK